MADAIGSLGLDTGDFQNAVQGAISNLASLATQAAATTGNLAGMALVVGGALAVGIYNARQRAKELDETLRDIKNSNPFNESIVSVNNLESRIKSLHAEIKKMDDEGVGQRIFRFIGSAHLLGGEGFDKSQEQEEKRRESASNAIEDAIQAIGRREQENLRVQQLELEGRKEESELLKNQLDYRQKIAKALEAGQGPQAVVLASEKKITDELIKQKFLRERQKTISGQAEDEAKLAIQNELNEAKNEQIIKDREADKQQKIADMWDEAERGTESDRRRHDMEEEAKMEKELRDQEKQDNEFLLDELRKQTAESEKRLEHNKRINQSLRDELEIEEVRKTQGTHAADQLRKELDLNQKIKEAIRDKNPEGEALLRQQLERSQSDFDRNRANQSPAEHRAEVRAQRQQEREDRNGDRRIKDLDDRIARGARGSENSSIEQRRRELEERNKRAQGVEDARRGNIPKDEKGYGQTDREYLKQIAEQLKFKE